jgi:rod shape-determining protein MreD
MPRSRLTLLLYLFFLLEDTLLKWIIPVSWQMDVHVAPHPMLVAVIFIGVYIHRHWSLAFGLGFGMLHDIANYGPMVGTYSFAMGLTGYLVGLVSSRTDHNVLTSMFWVVSGNLLFEWVVYGIYRIFRVTDIGVQWVFLHEMLPSVLINLLLALLMYVPMRRWLETIRLGIRKEETP